MFRDKNFKATQIAELGEFKLIEHLTGNIKIKNKSTKKGVGDDAAVLKSAKTQLVTSDILTEGVHFDLTYTPLKHLGYKAVVVNLSDIYAMNAIPKQILVSIAVSNKMSVEALEQLYEGIYLACDKYNVDLIGGDTSPSLTGLTISVTAIGEAAKNNIVYRNGAKETDIICVTGDLGAAYMGLQLLEREKKVFQETGSNQPDFAGKEYVLERFLKPEARKDIIEFFAGKNIKPTAMIDISDGLSSELYHICKQSGVGCRIYNGKIPIDLVTGMLVDEFKLEALIPALNGGEDYELLFTLPLTDYDKIKDNKKIKVIGHIVDKSEGVNLITEDGNYIELKAQGWNLGEHN